MSYSLTRSCRGKAISCLLTAPRTARGTSSRRPSTSRRRVGARRTQAGRNDHQRLSSFQPAYAVEIPQAQGGHGGGDVWMLQEHLWPLLPSRTSIMRRADQRAGAYSISRPSRPIKHGNGQLVRLTVWSNTLRRPTIRPCHAANPIPLLEQAPPGV